MVLGLALEPAFLVLVLVILAAVLVLIPVVLVMEKKSCLGLRTAYIAELAKRRTLGKIFGRQLVRNTGGTIFSTSEVGTR